MFNKSPEKQAEKAAQEAQAEAEKQARQAEKERQRFLASPVGQAHAAFERGDRVFQYSQSVSNQQAVVVAMVGASTTKTTSDPSQVLNAVCAEGWDLITGSFVFVEEGSQSRDKFMSSGQQVAVKGETVGYYLFRRKA